MSDARVLAKAQIVRENLAKLAAVPQENVDEFLGDVRNVEATLHRMQMALQAAIDAGEGPNSDE